MSGGAAGATDAGALLRRGAVAVAVLAAVGVVALWALLVWRGPSLSDRGEILAAGPQAWLVAGIFCGLAVAGAWAALRGAPLVLGLCGLISFLPVGLGLLFLPAPYPLVGVLDLAMVGAAAALYRADVAASGGG